MKYNKILLESLGLTVPEEEKTESGSLVIIEPHELPIVTNPNLPDMMDVEKRLLQGELERDEIINLGMEMIEEMRDQTPTIEPKYRRGHYEIMTMMFDKVKDALKDKTELQIKKKEVRLKEAAFVGRTESSKTKKDGSAPPTNNVIFTGSREELLKMMKEGLDTTIDQDGNETDK